MKYNTTDIRIQQLETKILQVLENDTLRFPALIVNFIERKIQRLKYPEKVIIKTI